MTESMSIDNKDLKEDSEDSMASSPEGEPETRNTLTTQEQQPPKRKGGRKPIYATSEERKQRNRQAQAAFRERRTEYIKQLEETIRAHENNLHQLQAAHRSAADECLMLRYKNSLLERILLEKGIDVQAELRAKTGSPNLGPTHAPQNLVQPPPIQRAIMNRHHQARRSASSTQPKSEPSVASVPPSIGGYPTSAASPKSRPTPPSHAHSPSSGSGPTYGSQTGGSPAPSDHSSTTMRQTLGTIKPVPFGHVPGVSPQAAAATAAAAAAAARAAATAPGPPPTSTVRMSNPGVTAPSGPYYNTPSFQNHIEQLEQEYESQADMMDDADIESAAPVTGPYPTSYASAPDQQMALSPTTSVATTTNDGVVPRVALPPHPQQQQHHPQQQYPSMTQLLDSGLDWDPFGLSASMQFPTPFTFDTSNMR